MSEMLREEICKGVEKFADKSLIFKLREIYSENQYLPAPFLSDGTICITALIIAVYFDRKPLLMIEEPERNIHPYLISRLVNMMFIFKLWKYAQ